MKTAKSDVLRRVPMFAGLSPAEAGGLADRAVEKRFAAGEVLFHEGDPCEAIYLLGEGRVRIFKTSPSGREIMLALDAAPSTVAEIPLFDGGPYPATVNAETDVVAYLIGTRDFQQVCRQHPEVALKLLAVVGRRLRQLVGVVEAVTFGSVRQRLAKMLLGLGVDAGTAPFELTETHQDIASKLGTVREVVSRNLARFQTEGLIKLTKRQARILDRDGLQREAETEF